MNRRLYRSSSDSVLAGVAGGLAAYLDTDPALVRIAWAILVPLTGGVALLAYIVGWIVIPEAPTVADADAEVVSVADPDAVADSTDGAFADESRPARPAVVARRDDGRAGIWIGLGLVLVGAWLLAREYVPEVDWGFVWPLVLVGIGVLILLNASRRRG